MPSINASNNIINKNYGKTGLIPTQDLNSITRSVGNIMADNGIKIQNTGNGLQISGTGRLPFDSRLHFGCNMIGFTDTSTFKVDIYEGNIVFFRRANIFVAGDTVELTASEEIIYIQLAISYSGGVVASIEHQDAATFVFGSTPIKFPLYKLEKDNSYGDAEKPYLIKEFYQIGDIYTAGEFFPFPFKIQRLNDTQVIVWGGDWRWNGESISMETDVGESYKTFTIGSETILTLKMTLDSEGKPSTLNVITGSPPDTDNLLHQYWTLGKVFWDAPAIEAVYQFWYGGYIETINLANIDYTNKQYQLLSLDENLVPQWDYIRIHDGTL